METQVQVRCGYCGYGLWDSAEGRAIRCPECGRVNRVARRYSSSPNRWAAWWRYAAGTIAPGLLMGSGAIFGTSQFGTPIGTAGPMLSCSGVIALVVGMTYVQAVVVERYLGPPFSRSVWVRLSGLWSLLVGMATWTVLAKWG